MGSHPGNPNSWGLGPQQEGSYEMGLENVKGGPSLVPVTRPTGNESPILGYPLEKGGGEPNQDNLVSQSSLTSDQSKRVQAGLLAYKHTELFLNPKATDYLQKKRMGWDFYLRGGCRRFLSQKGRRRGRRIQQSRGKSVDGRGLLGAYQRDEGISHPVEDNDDQELEVSPNHVTDPNLLEGLKIWDFGKKLGISSSLDDLTVARGIMGISSEVEGTDLEKSNSV